MPSTPAQRRAQAADDEHGQPRMKHRGKPVVFSQDALKSAQLQPTLATPLTPCQCTHPLSCPLLSLHWCREFVTGFRKRRQQRQADGAAQAAQKERRLRLQDRKEVSTIASTRNSQLHRQPTHHCDQHHHCLSLPDLYSIDCACMSFPHCVSRRGERR